MTGEKLKSMFAIYRAELDMRKPLILPVQLDDEDTLKTVFNISSDRMYAYFKFMCDRAQKFVDDGRIEKAMRWLGFLQGTFWNLGLFTLDELKHHSMP